MIALLIRTGTKRHSVYRLARIVSSTITNCINSHELTSTFVQRLLRVQKFGEVTLQVISSMYELLLRSKLTTARVIKYSTPSRIVAMLQSLSRKPSEYLVGLYLSAHLTLLHRELLSKGNANSVLLDIPDVLYPTLAYKARNIVLVHNHPSGDFSPSSEDVQNTKQVLAATNIIGVTLVDHIIIAKNGYYSFKESTSML